MSDLIKAFDGAFVATRDRIKRRGQVGRINVDGTISISVPTRPQQVYVRLGDGSDGTIIARNKGLALRAHMWVSLDKEFGEWVVEAEASLPQDVFMGDSADDPTVGKHTHMIGSGREYVIEALRFQPGRVKYSSGLTVEISPFRYDKGTGWDTWEGGTIDLTTYLPTTVGKWGWVIVGIDPLTNTAVAASGAEFSTIDELLITEIDSIAFAGNIPLVAIKTSQADTSLNNIQRYYDIRGFIEDHSRYFYKPGIAGGQTAYGGTLPNENLHLHSTLDADKGTVFLYGDVSAVHSEDTDVIMEMSNPNVGVTARAVVRARADSASAELIATSEAYSIADWASGGILTATGVGDLVIYKSSQVRIQTTIGVNALIANSNNIGIGIVPTVRLESFLDGEDYVERSTRQTIQTTNALSIKKFIAKSEGDMVDGFGPTIDFAVNDTAAIETLLGRIGAVRDGADTEGALIFQAGTNGIEEFARITSTGRLGIQTTTPGAVVEVSGTHTASPAPIMFRGRTTINSSDVNNQYGFYNDPRFSPTGASLSNIYAFLNIPIAVGSSITIANMIGLFNRVDTSAAFAGVITNARPLQIGNGIVSGGSIANYHGIYINDLTVGTSTNVGLNSNVSIGAGKYNLYIAGSAVNYLAGKTGIGIVEPDGMLHVHTATAGAVTADPGVDDLVVEQNANGGISILVPDASHSRMAFGSPSDPTGSLLQWNFSTLLFSLGSSTPSGQVSIRSGDFVEAIHISASGNVGIGRIPVTRKVEIAGSLSLHTDDSNYMLFNQVSATQTLIQKVVSAGQALIDFDPLPGDGSSLAFLRFFRSTNTTGGARLDVHVGNGTSTLAHRLESNGRASHLVQSTTAAVPPLSLQQSDVSEEFINFATTVGVGNAIENVGAKSLTVTEFVKIRTPNGIRYLQAGTIA